MTIATVVDVSRGHRIATFTGISLEVYRGALSAHDDCGQPCHHHALIQLRDE